MDSLHRVLHILTPQSFSKSSQLLPPTQGSPSSTHAHLSGALAATDQVLADSFV